MRIVPDGLLRRPRALVVLAVTLLCAGVITAFLLGREERGAATPRDAVELFVVAAANRDGVHVARVIRHPERPAPAVVEEAFALVPAGAHVQQIDVEMPFGTDVAFASVRGVVEGRLWTSRFTSSLVDGRWFVAVGQASDTRPRSSTTKPP